MSNKFKITKFKHGEAMLYVNKHSLTQTDPWWVYVLSIDFNPLDSTDEAIADQIKKALVKQITGSIVIETM